MVKQPTEAFARRQAQWNEFHSWEASRDTAPISFADRLSWFFSAFHSNLASRRQRNLQDIATKVEEIHQARERLAHLKRPK